MSFVPPSAEEQALVAKLQERLRTKQNDDDSSYKYDFTDTTVLRFLRGRKGVEDDAYHGLERHLQWRREHDVDTISSRTDEFANEYNAGKVLIPGTDKNGRPAVFVFAAKHDKNNRSVDELRKVIIYNCEQVTFKLAKPEEERMVICFDLSGFSLRCMDYEVMKLLIDILSYNYPDTLEVAHVINAPFIFWACWAVMKPWLDPVTAAKVTFINKDKLSEHFSSDVLQAIEAAQNGDRATQGPSGGHTATGGVSTKSTCTAVTEIEGSVSSGSLTAAAISEKQ